ncbi:MAG: UvrD-helicase domain-containing protein [Thermogutta sp.]
MRAKAETKNVVIRASAGSGKTFQLTRHFLWLIGQDETRLESILATTFSRKAAGEILDRILSDLAAAIENDASLQSLQATVNPHWNRTDCLKVLHDLIGHLHQLQIRTLDSFFVRIAQTFSFELQLPPGWTILEEDQDERLRSLALSQVLQNSAQRRQWLNLLFKGEAVRTIGKQLRDLIHEDYHRVFLESVPEAWTRLSPQHTLTNDKLQSILAALEAYTMAKDLKPALQTALGDDLERARNGQWTEFLRKGIANKVAKCEQTYKRVPIPHDLTTHYRKLVDHARNFLLRIASDQTKATYHLFDEFDKIYDFLKRDLGAITFHDVARYLRDYVCTNNAIDESEWVYRTGYQVRHLLLDEFQDTSALQWQVIEGLAKRICEHPNGTFFCVGDVKQSIYAWRGSEPGIFTYLEKSLPNICVQSLDVSWRSSGFVIDVVNKFFQRLPQLDQFKDRQDVWGDAIAEWCAQFTPHQTKREDYPGYCCIVVKEAETEEESASAQESEYDAGSSLSHTSESVLLKFVRQLYEAPSQPTIGILVRKNQAIEGIVGALRQAGFVVSQEGRNPVTASPAVQMILNLLRLADHPGDTAAAWRIKMSPLRAWLEREVPHGIDEGQQLQAFSLQLRRRLLHEGYRAVIRHLADDFAPYVPAEEHFWLEKLIELSSLYDNQPTTRVRDFLNWLDHQDVSGVEEARIRVMTVHGAKGLEFDAVLLPDLDGLVGRPQGHLVYARTRPGGPIDRVCRGVNQELIEAGVFPDEIEEAYTQFRRRWIMEDLSVLYVAMTRAIYGLYMFVAPKNSERATQSLTFSSLLTSVLTDKPPLKPGEIVFEHGDPDWLSKLGKHKRDEVITRTAPRPPVKLKAPSRATRSASWTAPHLAKRHVAETVDSLLQQPSDALITGTIIHMWLSKIRWLDQDELPSKEERRSVVVEMLGSEDRFDELDTLFKNILKQPAIQSLLSLRSYQEPVHQSEATPAHMRPTLPHPRWEVYLEQPFVVCDQETYAQGQFDRIVVLYDGDRIVGADIIDFKTDQLGQDTISGRIDFYRPQLELYQRAAAEWLHQPLVSISARLAFVRCGKIHRIC